MSICECCATPAMQIRKKNVSYNIEKKSENVWGIVDGTHIHSHTHTNEK